MYTTTDDENISIWNHTLFIETNLKQFKFINLGVIIIYIVLPSPLFVQIVLILQLDRYTKFQLSQT